MSDDPIRTALQSLRRDSLRASRRRDPALLISIGVADEGMDNEENAEEAEEADEELRRKGRARGQAAAARIPNERRADMGRVSKIED